MTLNHLNLTVDDAQAAARFLTTYFGMTEMGRNNDNFIFLTDENGIVLSLMKGKDAVYPANFHIGFIRSAGTRWMRSIKGSRRMGLRLERPPSTMAARSTSGRRAASWSSAWPEIAA